MEEDALRWRREVTAAGDHVDVVYDMAFREAAERYVKGGYKAVQREARLHQHEHEDEALRVLGGPKANTFVSIVLGQAVPLQPFVTPWLAVRAKEVDGRSVHMDGAALRRFIEAFPLLSDVTRPAVSAWIETRRGEVSANTVQRNIGAMRAFWGWLRERGHVAEDAAEPFFNLCFRSRHKP